MFESMKAFGLRYCGGRLANIGSNKQVWDFSGATNLAELHLLMSRTVLIRRQKKEVDDDIRLPPKNRSLVHIKADTAQLQVSPPP